MDFRISSNMNNTNSRYYGRINESRVNRVTEQINTSRRVNQPGDDPVAQSHSSRYNNRLGRLESYARNIRFVEGRLAESENRMNEVVDYLQDIREDALYGANGLTDPDAMKSIGIQVNQNLNAILAAANHTSDQDGHYLFSGSKTTTEPFLALDGRVGEGGENMVIGVEYRGDAMGSLVEIADNVHLESNLPGNRLFWARDQKIYTNLPAEGFQAAADTTVYIDNQPIAISVGDNINAVISKINRSGAPVRASLDPNNGFVLESTAPHQVWLEEDPGSTVLQDIGLTAPGDPPRNIAPNAIVDGGSLFDVVIDMRDALLSGDKEGVNRYLGQIDQALENLSTGRSVTGARMRRMENTSRYNDVEKLNYTTMDTKETGLDYAEAIMEYKMLEFGQRASLSAAARALQPTLMDFLR